MCFKFLRNIFPTKNPEQVHPEVADFLRLPVIYYNTVGLDPYESSTGENKRGILFHIYFAIQITNLTFVLAMEISYVVVSFRNNENFLESCMVMSYIGFVIVGELKFITVVFRKSKLTNLVKHLESFFPEPQDHEEYAVKYYLKRCHRYTKGFGGLYTTLVVVYNLFALTQYTILQLLHSPNAKQILPYVNMAPWNYRVKWRFYLTYLSQSMAGYMATCGHISGDLMIFAVAMQVIMHFDRLAKALKKFQLEFCSGSPEAAEKDLQKLRNLIAYHNKVLGLTDVMNNVFGIPLLLNFAASSMLVCFVGFQMTVGLGPEQVAKLSLILVSAMVEIYLLCYFSQMLIDASNSVSFAVYDMNWMDADLRFRKMLIFLALRAQRPVCLKATVFLDVSIATMSAFLQMSYKFFCAIRTMYQ
ncbi:odorant receptor 67a-like [Drosophila eugracilis]|uniref:odorant receptor 67a-like n=1 Tax=Drosophila eugracilis TaxID=29029 RepID=UPI001BD9D369|nr:odorant receptor 67a-like [Drosophila eugracilis]